MRLLTILLYFALIALYSHVFSEMKAERYVKMGALLLLGGTAAFTAAVVLQSSARLVTHFVVDLSQNLYFVGLVLTYVLWGAILKLRETRTRLIQLVLSSGRLFQPICRQLRHSEFVSAAELGICASYTGVWAIPPNGLGLCLLAFA